MGGQLRDAEATQVLHTPACRGAKVHGPHKNPGHTLLRPREARGRLTQLCRCSRPIDMAGRQSAEQV